MDIEPISKETHVQIIIRKFKDFLINKTFTPGCKLPSELELTRKLGISRTPVREAIKVLEALGVLAIKRGDGTYVNRSITPNAIQTLVFNLILEQGTPSELIELRLFFETAYTELATIKRTEQDLQTIRHSLERMGKLVTNEPHDPKSLLDEDLFFHLSVLNAAHNKLVYEIGKVIMDLFSATIGITHEKKEVSREAYKNHQKIYECILKQDLEEIRSVIKGCVNNWGVVVTKHKKFVDNGTLTSTEG